MPQRPCLGLPGQPCGRLVSTGNRCPEHQRPSWQHAERSAHRRGYDNQWRKLRARVLREEPTCRHCGAPATEADHIHPLNPTDGSAPGARLHRSNVQGLCHDCHAAKTQRERVGRHA